MSDDITMVSGFCCCHCGCELTEENVTLVPFTPKTSIEAGVYTETFLAVCIKCRVSPPPAGVA